MASEYFTTSETKKKQANYKGPSVDLRGEDAPQKDDYIKGSTTLLGGAQGALSGAATGAMVSGPGAPIGALVGGTIGFIAGAISADQKQQASFQQAIDAYKMSKDKTKLAKQVAKTEIRDQKRQKGMAARSPDLPFVAEYDPDIMAMSSEAGTSQYDQFLNKTYGVG
tara:strand:- start:40 stop:540 length:501 start_codon:yes stop_codon:yes gene_type:complete